MVPTTRSVRARGALTFFLLLVAVFNRASAAPTINKLEPPNWWVGLPSPMLLISGDGLLEAKISTDSSDVRVTRVQAEGTGHYLFVWLDTGRARPETVNLILQTPEASTTLQFPLQARKNTSDGFQGFGEDDVIYLIVPDRFADGDPGNDRPSGSKATYDRTQARAYHGGDLLGIREQLGYLDDLGVDTLWLTPIWKNANSDYHGYHVVDFYATDDHMGSLQEYEAMVADAHKLGMKVLIDYVVNHTGPEHPWIKQPPSPSWFHGTPEKHLSPVYTFSALTDPHATPDQKRGVLEGWFANMLPDLNTDDPLVSQYLLTMRSGGPKARIWMVSGWTHFHIPPAAFGVSGYINSTRSMPWSTAWEKFRAAT